MLSQVESLMYLDQHMDDAMMNADEMAKMSFLRQQDVTFICEKIKKVTKEVKEKKRQMDEMNGRMESVKKSRRVLLR